MEKVEITRKEVYRYLGYKNGLIDEKTKDMIESCIKELEQIAMPKFIYQVYPLSVSGNRIDFSVFQTNSKHLGINLKGCSKVALFAATLGIQVDLLIGKYSKLEVSKAFFMQAIAAAMIEDYCNYYQHMIEKEMEKEGLYARPRFSPGYGDFSLEHQKEITSILNTPKTIGLTVTDTLILAPAKSVTAIIGFSTTKQYCHKHGCEVCKKIDCEFRR